jgi:hypothetical protein
MGKSSAPDRSAKSLKKTIRSTRGLEWAISSLKSRPGAERESHPTQVSRAAPEDGLDREAHAAIDLLAKQNPAAAFDLGVDVLSQAAAAASVVVEVNAAALALIETRGDRIDRLQSENRGLLDALAGERAGG